MTNTNTNLFISAIHQKLIKISYFYHRLYTHLSAQFPGLADTVNGSTPKLTEIWKHRVDQIEKISGYEDVFVGWNMPNDLDYDSMFVTENMPLVFNETLLITRRSFQEFQERSEADDFELVLLSGFGVKPFTVQETYGRKVLEHGYYTKVERILDDLGIPLLDHLTT